MTRKRVIIAVVILSSLLLCASCSGSAYKEQVIEGVSSSLTALRYENQSAVAKQIGDCRKEYDNIVADIQTLDEQQAAAIREWEYTCAAEEKLFNNRTFDSLEDWERNRNKEYIPPDKPLASNWERPRNRLIEDKASVLGVIDILTDKQNASETALNILLQQSSNWEVAEVMTGVYQVEGYGLCYYDNQLSAGMWYYYEDGPSIEPRDAGSRELRRVLTMGIN